MNPKLITAASTLAVSVDDAAAYAYLTTTAEKARLTPLLSAAIAAVEQHFNRALITQTWELALDDFGCKNEIELPISPLQSVTSVKYLDGSGVEQTLSSSAYTVNTYEEPGEIELNPGYTWPTPATGQPLAVKIRYVVGHGSLAANVPDLMTLAVKVVARHFYENGQSAPIPWDQIEMFAGYFIEAGIA